MNRPASTFGSSTLKTTSAPSPLSALIVSAYAASKARDVRAAEPMANPLPVAAVVLPRESRASVRSRTSGSR